MFFFMHSMVTLSAVNFLITPFKQLPAVSVQMLDESGSQNQAVVFSSCIMAVVRLSLGLIQRLLRNTGGKGSVLR